MKVKILVAMAGVDYTRLPGDITVIEDAAEVARLIAAGYAVPVVEAPEVAVAKEPEKRVKK